MQIANSVSRGWAALRRHAVAAGAVVLTLLYTRRYLAFPQLPGNQSAYPLGWWGWFDQSKTLESARALAHLDFAAAHHWYPLGYAILGALFGDADHAHDFFFVDLGLLLAAYLGFVAFTRRCHVTAGWSVVLFLAAAAADHKLFDQWVIPWNTTATAGLIWLLLATTAAHLDGVRRPFMLGLLAAAIPLARPTEAVLAAPCVLAALLADVHARRLGRREVLRFMAGVGVVVVPYAALYLRIYGPHPTEYMVISRRLGFTLYDLGWKAYVILVEPRFWFMDGEGLLHRVPWMALGIAGIVPALWRGRGPALLALLLVIHGVLYLSYVDLLPTAFWRYDNVHYFGWTFPGYALLAWLLVRDLVGGVGGVRRMVGGAALAVTAVLLCVHLNPVPAATGEPAKMLDFTAVPPHFDVAYFGPWVLRDNAGDIDDITMMRGVPTPGGLRVLALRRPFLGDVAWAVPPEGWQGRGAPRRYRIGITIGRPCWLPLVRCRAATTPLLPPAP
jgi:hypothetical protein